MSVVTVRVDEETRRKMKQLRHVNWSSVLRDAVERKLEEEKGRDLAKALIANDRLRREAPPGWDSVQTIRFWRDRRYGKSSNRR